MIQVSLPDWNSHIEKQFNAHLLQLGPWGELKSAFGWKPVRYILDDMHGVQILFRRLPFGLTLGYMPKPVFTQGGGKLPARFWEEIDRICRQNRAVFLKIEPDCWQDQFPGPDPRFRTSPHNIQPPRTIIVSIKEGEDEILARMKQKCRYNIRLAQKKGIIVRSGDDLPAFHEMIKVTGGRDGFGVHSLAYYQLAFNLFHPGGKCELLTAEYQGNPLASLMVFAHEARAWYVFGASNDQERNRMPAYLLQWEAIRWAKAHGCEEYDLWGVPDEPEEKLESQFENRSDGLWGVYRFKRGFGGELKRAAQALDRVYNPVLYKFYLWRMAGREGG